MADRITLIKERVFDVKGTTRLKIGDPLYFKQMAAGSTNGYLKKITFDGSISAAPLAKLKVQLNKVEYDEYGGGSFESIDVTVVQASKERDLNIYLNGQYYPDAVKAEFDLGCDTACFDLETKFGYDHFKTGGDGYYGRLINNKQYYGMIVHLYLDTDMFGYDEVCDRMLALFPEIKK